MMEMIDSAVGLIPSTWEVKLLESMLCRKATYGIVQPGFHDEEGIPVLRVNNLKGGIIINSSEVLKVSKSVATKYDRTKLRGGEILITLVGNLGEVAIVDKKYEGWNIARAVGLLKLKDETDNYWVYTWLTSKFIKHYISTHANTTVQHTLNLSDLVNIPILLPPKYERELIVGFNKVLDQKITLLRQQNETLEEMTQTLFKRWFVDFEFPNAEGQPYRSADGEMVASELGEIPLGWEVVKLDNLVKLIIDYRGKTPKKLGMDWSPSGIPALSAKIVKGGKLIRKDAINYGSQELYDLWMKEELEKNDILLTSEAPLGELYYLADNTKYILSQRLFAIRVNEQVTSQYLYYYLSSYLGQFLLARRASGSTVQGIRQTELREIEITLPNKEVLNKVSNVFKTTIDKTFLNSNEIQTLTKLRDTLLPKLMSGEIRVPTALENKV